MVYSEAKLGCSAQRRKCMLGGPPTDVSRWYQIINLPEAPSSIPAPTSTLISPLLKS